MIVLRFKVRCQPDKLAAVTEAMKDVVGPSRALPGVIHFDVARDVTEPDVLVATEVFENAAARERQESLPQVAKVMTILPDSISAPPEATVFHVSSSEAAL